MTENEFRKKMKELGWDRGEDDEELFDYGEFEEEEGELVEPKYYLPIIPVILAQRQDGLAPGYRFSNMS